MAEKLKLYGFNNLTKSLSFNIYDICYAKSVRAQQDYIAYIDEQYNSERLTHILTTLTDMIGATVLNISKQDYEPQGASVTLLISEEPGKHEARHGTPGRKAKAGVSKDGADGVSGRGSAGGAEIWPSAPEHEGLIRPETQVGHLDKSHVTVHTYPEYHPETCLATFRVDIDVATCGEITPLSTLDYLISSFDSDIITIDYRVRGFTRDVEGRKLFLDHWVSSVQDYISDEILRRYDAMDINVYAANLFHTRMMLKDIVLQNYLFRTDVYELPPETRLEITQNLRREMIEIFNGRNIF